MITTELIELAKAFRADKDNEAIRDAFHDLLVEAGYPNTAEYHFTKTDDGPACNGHNCIIVDRVLHDKRIPEEYENDYRDILRQMTSK